VLVAESGVAALEVWEANRDRIGLVLTDVVMPHGISGLELAEQMRKAQPKLKIICATGYSLDLLQEGAAAKQGLTVVTKPFDFPRLLQLIRSAFAEA
jgi:CheY-like chemotaxis protein